MPVPSSMTTVGSVRRASSDNARSRLAKFFWDGETDVAKRKRPPASITGSGVRFSSGGGGGTSEGTFWFWMGDDECSRWVELLYGGVTVIGAECKADATLVNAWHGTAAIDPNRTTRSE
mmetsp:Transcript_45289/g.95019  ORF Transcript_45289/g.95019 Transcript_45289/m.95019 type:complete len:119 (-) Transcript_45289:105-461(-)